MKTHGLTGSVEYRAWRHMIHRCENPNDADFKDYGGRGISVCPEWRESFPAFLAAVGARPSPRHTIDRFPNQDGNYEPGNVRWATRRQQSRNRRSNQWVTAEGRTQLVADWAREKGLDKSVICYRLKRGWPADVAVTAPAGTRIFSRWDARQRSA